jgi:hypothetical protein
MYTKEQIQHNLQFNPKWTERGLVVLFEKQTYEEKQSGGTITLNNMGFNSSDSRYLTYCAKWVLQGQHLNEKHQEKCGKMLKKYWRQISELIKERGH